MARDQESQRVSGGERDGQGRMPPLQLLFDRPHSGQLVLRQRPDHFIHPAGATATQGTAGA